MHSRIARESRSQSQSHRSRSTPSAVLEDTMDLVDLFLSAFAPSWIANGSMRSISMTIPLPATQVAGCSRGPGGRSARTRWELKMRDRVFLQGPVTVVAIFVSKCSHCACSVSYERGPNACSYVKSPPPPPPGASRHPRRHPVSLTFLSRTCSSVSGSL